MIEVDTSNITVVNWSKDPFAQGSYSVRKAGDVYGTYDEMNDMDDRLTRIATALYDKGFFFIGEHVSVKYKGFMEGAVQSGKAIAKIVAQRLHQ
ncbi:FAD-dependent oxidoreductase [Candidatus Odyssella thessalonicensis]|uniref:FAD-dependent oxidoreductase n=1 Tax=Candidatus Odyssella thessalonicensis TaxID=84647 RepID=UPI0024783EB4|nr:FAD-dependent oxidoreductase [Candidatus Odyssella thessalonicensis]